VFPLQAVTAPGVVVAHEITSHFFQSSDGGGSDPPPTGEEPGVASSRTIVYMQKVLMHGDHAS
jgi:hypothetical protein